MKVASSLFVLFGVLLSSALNDSLAFQVQGGTSSTTSAGYNRPGFSSLAPATLSRSEWLQTAAGSVAAMVMAAPAANAKDVDSALKGTKKDPTFEECLSQCVYECTKPKGEEQKSRAQCLGECKKTCGKTNAQRNALTPSE